MRKEQLKEAVGELNLVDTVFEADGVSYIDTAVSVMQVYDLIDQLDEPEVLSQEWIDGKTFVVTDSDGDDYAVVAHSSLQNLLVPKQEKMKVSPQEDGFITECKLKGYSLHAFVHCEEVSDENCERLTRAWLDGYEVEEEQKYYVKIMDKCLTDKGLGIGTTFDVLYTSGEKMGYQQQFTEQEIKDYDERYWAFAEPVEQADFRLLF